MTKEWSCAKHGSDSFGFAFLCAHLSSGRGSGFNTDPRGSESDDKSRPPAWCDECEAERQRNGAYHTARVCGACYDEIRAALLALREIVGDISPSIHLS